MVGIGAAYHLDAQYYWVGNGGDWSDFANHWATTSGGSTFHTSAPTVNDDVFFDANSFSSSGQTVTLDINGFAANLNFTGVTNTPTLAAGVTRTLTVANDLTFVSAMSLTFTGKIVFTNGTNVAVELGNAAKTIPDLEFPNAAVSVVINTGTTTNLVDRVTFGNITLSTDGVELTIETSGTNSNTKTFANINLPNNCIYNISGPNASNFGDANRVIYTGDISVGDNGDGRFRGQYMEFQGNLTFGTSNECQWGQRAEFTGSTFTIGGSSGNDFLFSNDVLCSNNFNINGNTTMEFIHETTLTGNLTVAASADLTITTASNGDSGFNLSGTTTLNNSSSLEAGDPGNSAPFSFSDIICNESVTLVFQNGDETVSLTNLTIGSFNIVEFNHANDSKGGTVFSGNLVSSGDCADWRILRSTSDGDQANLSFSSAQNVGGNFIVDLNVSGATFTDTNGVNDGNNTGITFTSDHIPTTYYWRSINSGNWSNTSSWSTSSGGAAGFCVPGPADDVIFDANSFSGASPTFTMNLDQAFANNMSWSAVSTAATWEGGSGNELIVFGNFTMDADITNNFNGPVTFTMLSTGTNTVQMNGGTFNGDVEFDYSGGTWNLQDDMDINGDNSNLSVTNGTLNAGANHITLENNWTISSGAVFNAGTGSVTFDGRDTSGDQVVNPGGSAFYDLVIDRENRTSDDIVRLSAPMTVNNDLTLILGRLYDDGHQITGNATGTLSVADGDRLRLGTATASTSFPTNFLPVNISLSDNSRVEYHSQLDQNVAGNISYGRLHIQGGGSAFRNKTLLGPITVKRNMVIASYNNFLDNGFQVVGTVGRTFQMGSNTSYTIGTSTTTTQFPPNYDDIDLDPNSTIIYASGQDDNQVVKSLLGSGNTSYANLTLTNTSGTMRTKNLEGNINVRGDLTINTDNTLDVTSANNYTISLQGDLITNGTGGIDFRQNTVTLNGLTQQTMSYGGNTMSIYNLVINNASGAQVADNISIVSSGNIDFQNGIITPQGSEVITLQDGATVTSASDASFVDGVVEKVGNDPFTFPIGDGSFYRPITISAAGNSTDAFAAQYFATNPDGSFDTNAKEPSIDIVSTLEYWQLAVTNGTPTVDVTLSWRSNSGVDDPSSLTIAHWNGFLWEDYGNNGTTGDVTAGTITANNISSFSPITLGSTDLNNPLPVELISFQATLEGNRVQLDWATASELNNDYFMVQRSDDDFEWYDLGTVKGAGTTVERQSYTFEDTRPSFGLSYYRLKQVDLNGQFEYSPVRTVDLFSKENVRLFPNPVRNYLSIFATGTVSNVTITDLQGVVLYFNSQLEEKIPMSAFKEGVYRITFDHNGSVINEKIVVH